jgi:heptosyltransferase III
MAGLLKKHYPHCKILFLGRPYTKEVVALSAHVDEFIDYEEILRSGAPVIALKKIAADVIVHVFPGAHIASLAKKAGIAVRVGTTNRLYHWLSCNRLIKLSRKNSPLHEAQLNMKLLDFLEVDTDVPLQDIRKYYGFTRVPVLKEEFLSLTDRNKFNLILHPKSKGSAREWGLENFEKLIALLPEKKYRIFITGTPEDGKAMKTLLERNTKAVDLIGKLSLEQLIAFIAACDGLVAASTGPLHLAAALNKRAIGLFSPRKPIHPGRWTPLGANAQVIVFDPDCALCGKKAACDCITKISPEQIVDLLEKK